MGLDDMPGNAKWYVVRILNGEFPSAVFRICRRKFPQNLSWISWLDRT